MLDSLVEALAGLFWIFGMLFLYLIVVIALMAAIAAGIGLVGMVLSTPLLYLLPDVRRCLLVATGGDAADSTPPWRLALRLRYLLLSIGFGIAYGFTFVVLYVPIREYDLIQARVGPISVLVVVPVAFVLEALTFAVVAHQRSSVRTPSTSRRSVVLQWGLFLSTVVGIGTAATVYVATN